MPRFTYTAIDENGAEKGGTLDASDSRQATLLLRRQTLFPTGIVLVGDAVATPTISAPGVTGTQFGNTEQRKAPRWPFGKKISSRELAVLTRQLATLLRAGMPLLRGLEVLARQERNGSLRRVVESLGNGIKSGGTLSSAMAQHPRVFDRLYLNMIKAGEAGGVLDIVLERLARFQEKSLQLRGKVKAAMVYPLIVLGVATVILVGLMVIVVPKFKQIFADLLKGAPLPGLTQAVLSISDAVKGHYVIALGVGAAGWIAFKLFARTPRGEFLLDAAVIRLPLFGELFLKGVIARFGRTLGTLLSSGVPILPALLITRDTCENAQIAAAITEVHDRVKEGSSVARPLEATQVFPPMVTSMMDVGEHTGQMPEMLGKVADIYEDEVDNAVAGLSSLIEPIMILFLALMVGTIVIALFLPIVRIVQLLT
ncbi:MAG: type II secretion system F family protein [Lacunisphaera sp.]